VVELILSAVKSENDQISKALNDSAILTILTNHFFTYTWNSTLHFLYFGIAESILNGNCTFLARNLLVNAELPARILAALESPTIT
jgi:hypothetical protein